MFLDVTAFCTLLQTILLNPKKGLNVQGYIIYISNTIYQALNFTQTREKWMMRMYLCSITIQRKKAHFVTPHRTTLLFGAKCMEATSSLIHVDAGNNNDQIQIRGICIQDLKLDKFVVIFIYFLISQVGSYIYTRNKTNH